MQAGASLPEQNSGDIITEKLKENEAMVSEFCQKVYILTGYIPFCFLMRKIDHGW